MTATEKVLRPQQLFINYSPVLSKGVIKTISSGVKLFERNKEAKGDRTPYRICQEGALSILPLMTKRKVKVPATLFKTVIRQRSLTIADVSDLELKRQLYGLEPGSIVLYSEMDENIRDLDCIVALKFTASIKLMVSTEQIASLTLRYIDKY